MGQSHCCRSARLLAQMDAAAAALRAYSEDSRSDWGTFCPPPR
jgi:hypothetical protein